MYCEEERRAHELEKRSATKRHIWFAFEAAFFILGTFYGIMWLASVGYEQAAPGAALGAFIATAAFLFIAIFAVQSLSFALNITAVAFVVLAAIPLSEGGFKALFLFAPALFFAGFSSFAAAKERKISWLYCIPFNLALPVGIGGSMILYLTGFHVASYAAVFFFFSLTYVLGLRMLRPISSSG